MLGIEDAEHEESTPNAPILFISKLSCSLVGKSQTIKIVPGSLAQRAYVQDEITEQFVCSYGLNPRFQNKIENGQLQITGVDVNGEVRVVELSDHPFFISTLFQPQISSQPASPHPLIVAYLMAARSFQSQEKN